MATARILIAGRDELGTATLREQLERLDYEVVARVATPEAAVERAETEEMDLVLMEIRLREGSDGLAAGRILADVHGLPVVYITPEVDDETLAGIRASLPFGVLVRPLDLPDLKSAIELALVRHRMDTELRRREERYRFLFERNLAGVFRQDMDGRILQCNQAFAEIFGYASPEELGGTGADTLFPGAEAWEAFADRLREESSVINHELLLRRQSGSPVWILVNASLGEDPESGEPVIVGSVIDITERKRLEDELEEMAYHDPLTGLPNRRFLELKAGQALALADRSGTPVGLVFMDLVRFKEINDTRGHAAGDQVLVEVARRMRSSLRASDTAARIGGDEFVAVLTQVEDLDGTREAARRLLRCFEHPFELKGGPWTLHARLGAVLYPDHGDDLQELLARADETISGLKGRDQSVLVFHDPERDPEEVA